MTNEPPSGWYDDPLGTEVLRYHDGNRWTDSVQPRASAANPPAEAGWYPDPLNSRRSRYFDGNRWTDELRSALPAVENGKVAAEGVQAVADRGPGTSPAPVGIESAQGGRYVTAPPPEDRSAHPVQRRANGWVWIIVAGLGAAIVAAIVMGVALALNLTNEPTTSVPTLRPTITSAQPSTEPPAAPNSTPEEPTPAVPDPVEGTLSDTDVMDLLVRVMPDWLLRATAPNPGSNALASWISESQDPAAAAGGNFIAVLVYESSADSATSSEEAILDQIFTDFQFYYPYQQWVRLRCANTVIFVADLGVEFIEAEMPGWVTCQAF